MSYEQWRITYQNSEQAARAAYESSNHWHEQFQNMARAFDEVNKSAEKFGRQVLELQEKLETLEEQNQKLRAERRLRVVR